MTRVCRKCGTEKRLTEFCRDKRSASGRRHTCGECYRADARRRYAEKTAALPPKMSATVVVDGQKICGQCCQTLPVAKFSKDKSVKSGYAWRCKGCVKVNKGMKASSAPVKKAQKPRWFPPFKGYGFPEYREKVWS